MSLKSRSLGLTKFRHDLLGNCDEQLDYMLLPLRGKYRSQRSCRAERWKVKVQHAPFGLRVPDARNNKFKTKDRRKLKLVYTFFVIRRATWDILSRSEGQRGKVTKPYKVQTRNAPLLANRRSCHLRCFGEHFVSNLEVAAYRVGQAGLYTFSLFCCSAHSTDHVTTQ